MEFPEMKDRIAHIIRAKNLTAAEFALRLGIQPSNISHLLSGRNNPSLDFVKKLKETFPEYSLEWIIFGSGPITVSTPFVERPTPSPIDQKQESVLETSEIPSSEPSPEPDLATNELPALPTSPASASLEKIIFVYSDNSFEVLRPR